MITSFTGNNQVWLPLTKNWQVSDYPLGWLGHAKNGYCYRHSLNLLSLLKLLFTMWLWEKNWQLGVFLGGICIMLGPISSGCSVTKRSCKSKYHAYCSDQLLRWASDRRVTWKLRDMYTADLQVDLYFKPVLSDVSFRPFWISRVQLGEYSYEPLVMHTV